MLSLANYGSSGSESDNSENEGEVAPVKGWNTQNGELILEAPSTIHLPKVSIRKLNIKEEDDEFLQKKEVPRSVPPKKEKVRIMIPRMSEFKDDEDDEKKPKVLPANRKKGLLSMLPKPSIGFATAPRQQIAAATTTKEPAKKSQSRREETSVEQPKKIGFIPYALMSHSRKPEVASDRHGKESDDDDDEVAGGSFFTFASKDDDLPVIDDQMTALVEKEVSRMEQRKRHIEGLDVEDQFEEPAEFPQHNQQQHQGIDEEAMKALLGGNKAKRSKLDGQIIDLSAAEVMPNRDEWLRKTLAGETSYQPTGNIQEKVRNHVIR